MSDPQAAPELPAGRATRAYAHVVLWLAPLLVAVVAAGAYGAYRFLPSIASAPNATTDSLLPQHPASLAVEREATRLFGAPFDTPYLVVQRNPSGMSQLVQKQSVAKAMRVHQGTAPAEFRGVAAVPILNTGGVVPGSREHGTTIVTYLYFPPATGSGTALTIANAYAGYLGPRLDTVGVTGAEPARVAQFNLIQSRIPWTEVATVALIVLILGIALRAVLAPLITVSAAGIAFLISQHILGWIEAHSSLTMPNELTGVAVALMLGIVTDYSVFYLSTARDLLREGASSRDAVRRSTILNTPIVVTAGLVVSLGVACLMLGTLGFFQSFGPGMAVTVATGLVVSVLLIPACLRLFGRALFWPGLRGAPPRVSERRKRLARFLTAKPVAFVAAAAAFAGLGIAASGLSGGLPLGLQLIQGLPSDGPVARAAQQAGEGFAPGVIAPTELLLRAPGIERNRSALARLQRELAGEPHVAGVVGPADQPSSTHLGLAIAPHGGAARYALMFDSDPTEADAIAHLERVESDLPALLSRAGLGSVEAGWGGETALGIETVRETDTSLWRVIAAAFAVNFLLLLVFLRSLLAPLYLLLASAAALAATFGVTIYVFQDVLHGDGISYYLPVAFSALLLSLGSDYNIFVVGRVWKESERHPLREAVATAVPRAGRAITVAGLALALSFTLLAIIPITPFAVMAFAMGVGILIDTIVVRSVLVPALIVLFGKAGLWPRVPCVAVPASGAADEPLARQPRGRQRGVDRV